MCKCVSGEGVQGSLCEECGGGGCVKCGRSIGVCMEVEGV